MQKFKVIWTKNAEFDLEQIIEYIKYDSVLRAKEIFFEIKNECDKLYYFPTRKRVVPQMQRLGIVKYRELIYKRWKIIFKISDDKVYILLAVDSSRNLEDVLFYRLIKTPLKKL